MASVSRALTVQSLYSEELGWADVALYRFSPSGSHFGETGGAFFALYGIAPGASAVLRQEPGGRFLRYMASASAPR